MFEIVPIDDLVKARTTHPEKRNVKGYVKKTKRGYATVAPTIATRLVASGKEEKKTKAGSVRSTSIHWIKKVHNVTAKDIKEHPYVSEGSSGRRKFSEQNAKLRTVSYTVYIPGSEPRSIVHVSSTGSSIDLPETQDIFENTIPDISGLKEPDIFYVQREGKGRTTANEIEEHIESRLKALKAHYDIAKQKFVPSRQYKTHLEHVKNGETSKIEPGKGPISKKIEALAVPFKIEGLTKIKCGQTESGQKVFFENRLALLNDNDIKLLLYEYAPMLKDCREAISVAARKSLAASGVRPSSMSEEIKATLESAGFLGLYDAVNRYSAAHKANGKSFAKLAESRIYAGMLTELNESLLPRWTAKTLTFHEREKRFAFGEKQTGEITVDEVPTSAITKDSIFDMDPEGVEIEYNRQQIMPVAFISAEERLNAISTIDTIRSFYNSVLARAKESESPTRTVAALKKVIATGVVDNRTKLQFGGRAYMNVRSILREYGEEHPELFGALTFMATIKRKRKEYSDHAIDIMTDGSLVSYDLDRMEAAVSKKRMIGVRQIPTAPESSVPPPENLSGVTGNNVGGIMEAPVTRIMPDGERYEEYLLHVAADKKKRA
jgi:hypothetical protein